MERAALQELLQLKKLRERGLRNRLSALAQREATLNCERREAHETRLRLRSERDELFAEPPAVGPLAFRTLKMQLTRCYEESRAASETSTQIDTSLVLLNEERNDTLLGLNRNAREQEKLSSLMEELDGY
ncbi:hypothetical protein [Burkholderia sp. WSM2232]|uniref:hypothetical protein n=1 Tax=Burkholderia sp. WSM2232 TaxID=944436 RepID=UPI000417592B|nr:hypothetical protein [Burkholderia sp. WSM2232]